MNNADPIALCLAGRISPPVALARLLLAGQPAAAILAALDAARPVMPHPHWAALHGLAREQLSAGRDTALRAIAAASDHAAPAPDVSAIARFFDDAVTRSPEASVAFYSLGDPAILERATAEIVAWLDQNGLLGGDVLDLGCGIGRVAIALAPRCRSVLGLDVSPAMVAEAARRAGAAPGETPNLRFAPASGRDLAGVSDTSLDLVLAVDSFPYVVQLGAAVADRHMADAARILRPGGAMAILNLSYGRTPEEDAADVARWSARHGWRVRQAGQRPFALWDGSAFLLSRDERADGFRPEPSRSRVAP